LVGSSGATQRVHREGGAGRGAWGVACTEASLFWALGKDALKACRCRWGTVGRAQVSWLGTVSGNLPLEETGQDVRWMLPNAHCMHALLAAACSAAGMHY